MTLKLLRSPWPWRCRKEYLTFKVQGVPCNTKWMPSDFSKKHWLRHKPCHHGCGWAGEDLKQLPRWGIHGQPSGWHSGKAEHPQGRWWSPSKWRRRVPSCASTESSTLRSIAATSPWQPAGGRESTWTIQWRGTCFAAATSQWISTPEWHRELVGPSQGGWCWARSSSTTTTCTRWGTILCSPSHQPLSHKDTTIFQGGRQLQEPPLAHVQPLSEQAGIAPAPGPLRQLPLALQTTDISMMENNQPPRLPNDYSYNPLLSVHQEPKKCCTSHNPRKCTSCRHPTHTCVPHALALQPGLPTCVSVSRDPRSMSDGNYS